MNFDSNQDKVNDKPNRFFVDVISAQIMHIDHAETFSSIGYNTLLYSCEGNCSFQIHNPNEYYCAEGIDLSSNNVLFVHDGSDYKIEPHAESIVLLVICFDLYIYNNIASNAEGDIILHATPYSFTLYPLLNIISEQEQTLISLLIHYTKKVLSNQNLVCSILETFLESKIIGRVNSFEYVLSNVNAVVFQSERPVEQNTEFYFKNVEIWSDDPEKNSNATLLFEASVEHKFIEKPSIFEYRYFQERHEEICRFFIEKNHPFKIWFFPDLGKKIDLLPFWKTCCVRFSVKCNLETQIKLSLSNKTNNRYRFIALRFNIAKKDEWQISTLPLSNYFYRQSGSLYVDEAISYIRHNYAKKISLNHISNHLHIHVSYLHYLFRKHFNQTVNQYIINYRILKSKELLIKTERTIESISGSVGFYDQRHFSKTFQKNIGMTPTEYRKKNKLTD